MDSPFICRRDPFSSARIRSLIFLRGQFRRTMSKSVAIDELKVYGGEWQSSPNEIASTSEHASWGGAAAVAAAAAKEQLAEEATSEVAAYNHFAQPKPHALSTGTREKSKQQRPKQESLIENSPGVQDASRELHLILRRWLTGTAPEAAAWSKAHGPVTFTIDALLRGASQVYLCNNPITGVAVVVAFAVASPINLGAAALGLVVSTGTAFVLGLDTMAIQNGLYGYNGLLCGSALATFHPAGAVGPLLAATAFVAAMSSLGLAAIGAVLVQAAAE